MVPQLLRDLPQWLVWSEEPNGDKKPRKIPRYISGAKRMGKQGDDADRQSLTIFDAAQRAMTEGHYKGVGFAFLPGDGLIGIDLDKVIDAGSRELAPLAREIVERCASFTEYSPSGLGLHIFVRGQTTTFKSDDIGVEVYCNAQFFTVTGKQFGSAPDDINPISDETLAWLRGLVDEAKETRRQQQRPAQQAAPTAKAPPPAVAGQNDFQRVNDAAMQSLEAWVPSVFPAAKHSAHGYRVRSKDIGRDLEEDISITRDGIVDWGVNETDAHQGRRTPIDLVIEWTASKKPAEALHWLAGLLGLSLAAPRAGSNGGGGLAGAPPPSGSEGGDLPPKPQIRWEAGELPRIVSEAEAALISQNAGLYQRGPMLVRVVRKDGMSVRNFERPAGSLGIVMVDRPYLVEAMTRSACWLRYDARKEDWRPINAPEQAAATYLARNGHWNLPRLLAAISAPTLRPDGTLLQVPGYDARTATWYDPLGLIFPEIPDQPTKRDATLALDALLKALQTFPFQEPADLSVALSLVLCSLVRRSLTSAPLGAISAPVMGSGKTLLADCISILCTGVAAPAMQYPETDEEASKMALAVLAEGDAVVLIDNVERPLDGEWLCAVLTSETYRARMLGRTEMMTVPTSTLFLATGNQLVVQGDLRTRTLLCRIDPQVEKPEQREFKRDMRAWITRHRPRLVAAGLTLMRAYIVSEEKATITPWGRFERWSEMIRAPLVWLGCADPCSSLKALEDDDPQRIQHMRLMTAWEKSLGTGPNTARDALTHATEAQTVDRTLYDAICEIAPERGGGVSPRRFAHWLGRYIGRIVEGKQLVKSGKRDHVQMFSVKKVGI